MHISLLYLLSQGFGGALSNTVKMVTGISHNVIGEDRESSTRVVVRTSCLAMGVDVAGMWL